MLPLAAAVIFAARLCQHFPTAEVYLTKVWQSNGAVVYCEAKVAHLSASDDAAALAKSATFETA